MADAYLKAFMPEIMVEGGDPSRPYLVNYETMEFPGGLYRVQIFLFDASIGEAVARWSLMEERDFSKTLPDTIVLSRDRLAKHTGITAIARINWSAIDWTKSLTTYESASQSGLKPDRVIDRATIMRSFAAGADPKIKLTVGAGAQFPSFAAAIRSLYIQGIEINRSTFPCSDIAAFSNQVLIECVESGYSERMPTQVRFGIAESLLVPPFVTLRGKGDTRLFLSPEDSDAPVLEAPFSIRVEGMVLDSGSRGYAIHIDGNNGLSRRSENSVPSLNFPLATILERTTFLGSPRQRAWLLGCGIGNGQLLRLKDCRCQVSAPRVAFGVHTSPDTTDPARIEVIGSSFNDREVPGAAAMQFVKSHAMDVQHEILIEASDYGRMETGNSAGGADGFKLV